MVCRQWLLLSLLTSCSAEFANVIHPPMGISSISSEDLKRDVWMQVKPEPDYSSEDYLKFRFGQMGSAYKAQSDQFFCSKVKDAKRVAYVEDKLQRKPYWSAVLLSLAKGLEGDGWEFCFGFPQESALHPLELTPLLDWTPIAKEGVWSAESIHYERLAKEVQSLAHSLKEL